MNPSRDDFPIEWEGVGEVATEQVTLFGEACHRDTSLPTRLSFAAAVSYSAERFNVGGAGTATIASLALLRMQQHTKHAGIAREFDAFRL